MKKLLSNLVIIALETAFSAMFLVSAFLAFERGMAG